MRSWVLWPWMESGRSYLSALDTYEWFADSFCTRCRYAKVKIGDPRQEIEMDLNMLVFDFYVVTTTSRKGSRYDDYFSQSAQKSLDRPYPTCHQHADLFTLPTVGDPLPLSFPYCRPSKFSRNTLGPSGSMLGLAPSEHLSQTGSVSLVQQLFDKEVIQHPIFSLMLINGEDGVLSIGGTAASTIEMVVRETENTLNQLGGADKVEVAPVEKLEPLAKRGRHGKEVVTKREDWETGWVWTDVQGAEGWWQLLMRGVWVDGSKVLQNQAVVIDVNHLCFFRSSPFATSYRKRVQANTRQINSPFILAPPLAAKAFYASVSGSRQLPPPFSNFYVFPCLNPPVIHFEFSGTPFPFMQGGRGAEWSGIPGGKFSLGRLEAGSGYCVGAVVETRMGIREERDEVVYDKKRGRSASNRGGLGGNGMRDVWVIGEGFFRGVGGVFDVSLSFAPPVSEKRPQKNLCNVACTEGFRI